MIHCDWSILLLDRMTRLFLARLRTTAIAGHPPTDNSTCISHPTRSPPQTSFLCPLKSDRKCKSLAGESIRTARISRL